MSPPATQTIAQAEAAVLASADALFYERGVSAVSVADIRDRSCVSLRRIYSLFATKGDIVTGWLRHRHTGWMADLAQGIEHRCEQGSHPVEAVFDWLEQWLAETHYRGCGFINTLAESGELTAEHTDLIRAHKKALAEYLDDLPQTRGRGDELAVLIDGAIVQAAVFASPAPVATARNLAMATV